MGRLQFDSSRISGIMRPVPLIGVVRTSRSDSLILELASLDSAVR